MWGGGKTHCEEKLVDERVVAEWVVCMSVSVIFNPVADDKLDGWEICSVPAEGKEDDHLD